jgi:hypothetical protein
MRLEPTHDAVEVEAAFRAEDDSTVREISSFLDTKFLYFIVFRIHQDALLFLAWPKGQATGRHRTAKLGPENIVLVLSN